MFYFTKKLWCWYQYKNKQYTCTCINILCDVYLFPFRKRAIEVSCHFLQTHSFITIEMCLIPWKNWKCGLLCTVCEWGCGDQEEAAWGLEDPSPTCSYFPHASHCPYVSHHCCNCDLVSTSHSWAFFDQPPCCGCLCWLTAVDDWVQVATPWGVSGGHVWLHSNRGQQTWPGGPQQTQGGQYLSGNTHVRHDYISVIFPAYYLQWISLASLLMTCGLFSWEMDHSHLPCTRVLAAR